MSVGHCAESEAKPESEPEPEPQPEFIDPRSADCHADRGADRSPGRSHTLIGADRFPSAQLGRGAVGERVSGL